MKEYKSEASINKILAELQLAGTAATEMTEDQEDSYEVLLRKALESEEEAIKIYLQLKEKSEKLGSQVLVKAFDEIKKDEQEHVGNLNYLLKILCPSAIEVQKDGEEEEIKVQAGIEE
jgi:rubrerythrin